MSEPASKTGFSLSSLSRTFKGKSKSSNPTGSSTAVPVPESEEVGGLSSSIEHHPSTETHTMVTPKPAISEQCISYGDGVMDRHTPQTSADLPTQEMLKAGLAAFRATFSEDPEVVAFAPGRVNMIGEHVDYSGGFVAPFALPLRTICFMSRCRGPKSMVASMNMESGKNKSKDMNKEESEMGVELETVSFTVSPNMTPNSSKSWSEYVRGTVAQMMPDLPTDAAFMAVYISNVPIGSGLSSSAALEVSTAVALEALYGLRSIEPMTLAKRCQKAEAKFAGTPCGIMDQSASLLCRPNHIMLLDCASEKIHQIPYGESGGGTLWSRGASNPVMIITNSHVKHNLSDQEYPVRVKQCESALNTIRSKVKSVSTWRDVTPEILDSIAHKLSKLQSSRAKHVVTENQRTVAACEALRAGDFTTLGSLMTSSHQSLQFDYEVSCTELDFLVEKALEQEGVLGARMTGGGFGGCTITLVEAVDSTISRVIHALETSFFEKFGVMCECFTVVPSAGAGLFDIDAVLSGSLMDGVSREGNLRIGMSSPPGWSEYWLPTMIVTAGVVSGLMYFLRRQHK